MSSWEWELIGRLREMVQWRTIKLRNVGVAKPTIIKKLVSDRKREKISFPMPLFISVMHHPCMQRCPHGYARVRNQKASFNYQPKHQREWENPNIIPSQFHTSTSQNIESTHFSKYWTTFSSYFFVPNGHQWYPLALKNEKKTKEKGNKKIGREQRLGNNVVGGASPVIPEERVCLYWYINNLFVRFGSASETAQHHITFHSLTHESIKYCKPSFCFSLLSIHALLNYSHSYMCLLINSYSQY